MKCGRRERGRGKRKRGVGLLGTGERKGVRVGVGSGFGFWLWLWLWLWLQRDPLGCLEWKSEMEMVRFRNEMIRSMMLPIISDSNAVTTKYTLPPSSLMYNQPKNFNAILTHPCIPVSRAIKIQRTPDLEFAPSRNDPLLLGARELKTPRQMLVQIDTISKMGVSPLHRMPCHARIVQSSYLPDPKRISLSDALYYPPFLPKGIIIHHASSVPPLPSFLGWIARPKLSMLRPAWAAAESAVSLAFSSPLLATA